MTRQFSPEEVAELQARVEAANKELLEAEQATEESSEAELQPAAETPVEPSHEDESQDDANAQQESVLIL